MRKISWLAVVVLFAAPAGLCGQQSSQQQSTPPESSQASQASSAKAPASHQDTLAEAARKAREQHKTEPKTAKVFTNDNLPTAGGISTVGEASAEGTSEQAKTSGQAAAPSANGEAYWRAKFAGLRQKLQQDQEELGILQREIGQQQLQFYNGNPQKAAQDQMSGQPLGAEYNKKRSAIEAKQKQVADDQQAISDAETDMRRADGDPGWER
jgi:hypothetical protein